MQKKYLVRPFEIKEVGDDGTFEGYGSVFNNVDHSRDVVVPGAFAKSIAKSKSEGRVMPILWQHDAHQPIGGYDEIYEDDYGLYVKGSLLVGDVRQAKEAHALMKAGVLSGLSIGYIARDGEFDKDKNAYLLKELELWEVSPVTFPDNDLARVTAVKNINVEDIQTKRDFERFLRDAGFSRSGAKSIASKGFVQRDAAYEDAELVEIVRQTTNIFRG